MVNYSSNNTMEKVCVRTNTNLKIRRGAFPPFFSEHFPQKTWKHLLICSHVYILKIRYAFPQLTDPRMSFSGICKLLKCKHQKRQHYCLPFSREGRRHTALLHVIKILPVTKVCEPFFFFLIKLIS